MIAASLSEITPRRAAIRTQAIEPTAVGATRGCAVAIVGILSESRNGCFRGKLAAPPTRWIDSDHLKRKFSLSSAAYQGTLAACAAAM